MTDPDVLVVGAGPAGSAAALVLARAGVRVRLIDRASFPRAKLCGDTLNPGALSIVERLGVGHVVRAHARAFTGMLLTGPGGSSVATDYPDGIAGAAVERRDFDLLLLNAATSAGADFRPGVHVVVPAMGSGSRVSGVRIRRESGTEELRARVVIACDGRRSTLAFALGLARFARHPKRWAFGCYYSDVDGLTSRGEMHIQPEGYTGVAPLDRDVANVCVVRELEGAAFGGTGAAIVERAIAGHSALRERFARARRVSPVVTLGPLAVDAIAAGCPGLLLAGDAAGFIDPMTGDGLRFALRGGELAAEAALAELEGKTPAHEHLRITRKQEFSAKWRLNRVLRSLVAWPRGVSAAEAIASRWDAPFKFLIGVAGDVYLARS
jgi:geranylgeranyl reductase family protein